MKRKVEEAIQKIKYRTIPEMKYCRDIIDGQ